MATIVSKALLGVVAFVGFLGSNASNSYSECKALNEDYIANVAAQAANAHKNIKNNISVFEKVYKKLPDAYEEALRAEDAIFLEKKKTSNFKERVIRDYSELAQQGEYDQADEFAKEQGWIECK